LGSCAHGLDGVHHIRLLRQKRVAQIGGPANVTPQDVQHIGKGDKSLNARVPVLLLGSVHALSRRQIPILLEPLFRIDNFQGICAGRQDLAQERIGIERHRRHKIVELIRTQQGGRRRGRGGRIG
jgi:hypothetical protein